MNLPTRKVCPTCNKAFSGGKQFCPEDGTALVVESSAPSLSLPDAPPSSAGDWAKKAPHAQDAFPQTVIGVVPTEAQPQDTQETPKRDDTLMYHANADADVTPPMINSASAIPDTAKSSSLRRKRAPQGKMSAVDHEAETRLSSLEDIVVDEDSDQSAYIGKVVDDRYLVKSLIGRGGMGAVYRVEQIHLRKEMAIKLLHENLLSKKQLISRFTREARAISRLSSPHTVMVYDFGRWGEVFYLVMELLEGEPLDAMLNRDGPCPAKRATAILLQMCDSLAEAHRAGIVHRDLKPENIMLLEDGPHPDFVKILDFGLAKVEDVDDPYTIHSQKDIFGTPFYMSPEQIRAGEIDGRSDIYAVGALAFRMLTGKQVFGNEKNTFDILKAHLMQPPPTMSSVTEGEPLPEALEHIIAKCLAKAPNDRFQTMEEFSEALVKARKGEFSASTKVAKPAVSQPEVVTKSAPEEDSVLDDEDLANRIRRTNRMRRFGFLGGLIAFIMVGVWILGSLNAGGVGDESEPNDAPDQANVLDNAGVARGIIGDKRGPSRADQDCFRLPEIKPNEELSVTVTGMPTMDLELSFYDERGVQRGLFNHRGVGHGEVARYVDTRTKPTTVCVTEHVRPGGMAGESKSDEYKLTAQTTPKTGSTETEPNDGKQVGDLPGGSSVRGTLDGPADLDIFTLKERFRGRMLRIKVERVNNEDLGGLQVTLLDANERVIQAKTLGSGEQRTTLAFASTGDQEPAKVALRWSDTARKSWTPAIGELAYTIWYRVESLTEQGEQEPNDDKDNAGVVIMGAWHIGDLNDDAQVDWLRVEAGDAAMRRMQLELEAPDNGALKAVVFDAKSGQAISKIDVNPRAPRYQGYLPNGGGGYLLKLERGEVRGRAKRRPQSRRYRVRARWAVD